MDSLTHKMKLLHGARTLAGLRQDELALRAGVTRQMIIRIENGDKSVPAGSLEQVQNALEKAGIVFIASTSEQGMGIAFKK